MACEGLNPLEYWMQYRFMDGAVCYYGDQIGVLAVMLIFFGITFTALWQSSGSIMLPVVVLIVLGPLVVLLLPAVGVQFVAIILVFMLGIGGFWLYQRAGLR